MTKFKVGDWWRTRGGSYEQITNTKASVLDDYTISTNTNMNSYTEEGLFVEGMECDNDLVQKMKPPVWEEDHE